MTLSEWLTSVRERLDAATPGPWTESYKGEGHYNKRIAECLVADVYAKDEFDINQGYANAELIAHAPEDLSTALKVIQELSEALRDVQENTFALQPNSGHMYLANVNYCFKKASAALKRANALVKT